MTKLWLGQPVRLAEDGTRSSNITFDTSFPETHWKKKQQQKLAKTRTFLIMASNKFICPNCLFYHLFDISIFLLINRLTLDIYVRTSLHFCLL